MGIISANTEMNLNLMPNPNNGIFDILIETNKKEDLELTIVNSLGQTILTNNFIAEGRYSETVDLTVVKPGIYLLMLKGKKMLVMKKMLIN